MKKLIIILLLSSPAVACDYLDPLCTCQAQYDQCVVTAAEQEAELNGCYKTRGLYHLVKPVLNVLNAPDFQDYISCNVHLYHCGNYAYQQFIAVNNCVNGR